MAPRFSELLIKDLVASLDAALARDGIVNIPHLAEEIRQRNAEENAAFDDIAYELMRFAQMRHAAMKFETEAAQTSDS
jgi:hypothetical protein